MEILLICMRLRYYYITFSTESNSPLSQRRCLCQLSQRESPWQTGRVCAKRRGSLFLKSVGPAIPDRSSFGVAPCFTASSLVRKALTPTKAKALFGQKKLFRHANGSPFEERLPPAGGRCRVSDRGRNLDAKRPERATFPLCAACPCRLPPRRRDPAPP